MSWALLAGHGLIWLAVLAFHPADAIGDDIARFVQIASAPGTLYRDVPVEYMPLEALLIRGLLDAPVGGVAVRVVVLSAVCDVLAFWLVGRLFGRPAGRAYLAIALPLQVFMIFRLDMVAVVLVLSALALAASGRRRTAGAISLWRCSSSSGRSCSSRCSGEGRDARERHSRGCSPSAGSSSGWP